jgi:ABC-type sugar transport system substrate-binding protein
MRRTALVGWNGVFTVLVAAGVLAIVLVVLRLKTDITLSILGLFTGLAAFGLSQYNLRRPRVRRVVFLAKSRSTFAHNICRGLNERLDSFPDIRVDSLFPPTDVHDAADWQLAQLRSIEIARADALVIVPANEREEIWLELAACIRRGTLVVTVDTKPPNQLFREHDTEPPFFVGSDFMVGGRFLGGFLAEQLDSNPSSRLLIAVGPENSWPACERASWLLYELSRAGAVDRLHSMELIDWDAVVAAETLHEEIRQIQTRCDGHLYVFTGNDKVAVEVDRRLRHASQAPGSVLLVGYDGTTNEDGGLLIDDLEHGLATVNGLPIDQGRACAEFIAWVYENEVPHFRKRVIPPRLEACR